VKEEAQPELANARPAPQQNKPVENEPVPAPDGAQLLGLLDVWFQGNGPYPPGGGCIGRLT